MMGGEMARPPLPSISTTHLSYLVSAAAADTWADAASHLGVTPSALSQGIAELERRLGWPLFERSGRRRVLAPGADQVVSWAETVLASTADLVTRLDEQRSGRAGMLRVGLIDTAMITTFSGPVALTQRELGPRLRVEVGTSTQLTRKVHTGELDIAVVVGGNPALVHDDSGYGGIVRSSQVRDLVAEPLVVLAPAADEEATAPAWVLPPSGSTTRTIIDGAVRSWSTAKVVMESHDTQVLQHMAAAGFGWTVLPVGALGVRPGQGPDAHVQRFGLRLVKGVTRIARPLVLVQRIGGPPNEAVDRFATRCLDSVRAN
jgi:DNA-binding transcriptional LysR family regulator